MESMGNRIRRLRIENGFTQEELGEKVGLQKSAIAKYEKGNVENMKRSMILKMSEVFEVSPSYLMALDDMDETREFKKDSIVDLPYLGSVAAGLFEESYTTDNFLSVPSHILKEKPNHYFILKVNGDSMNRVIANGHFLVVLDLNKTNNSFIKNNDIVVVKNGSEYTVKRIKKTETMIHLEPDSYIDEFHVQSFAIDSFNELMIVGKVIYSFKEF